MSVLRSRPAVKTYIMTFRPSCSEFVEKFELKICLQLSYAVQEPRFFYDKNAKKKPMTAGPGVDVAAWNFAFFIIAARSMSIEYIKQVT